MVCCIVSFLYRACVGVDRCVCVYVCLSDCSVCVYLQMTTPVSTSSSSSLLQQRQLLQQQSYPAGEICMQILANLTQCSIRKHTRRWNKGVEYVITLNKPTTNTVRKGYIYLSTSPLPLLTSFHD